MPSDQLLLRALARQPTPRPPVWFHRQAGRAMPRFRAIADQIGFLEMCERPDIVAEVTIEPVERCGVDAAIIFADILLIPRAMGVRLDILPGAGPQVETPIRSLADVERLDTDAAEALAFVLDGIRLTRRALGERVPLIGFAGAPFTVAAYLIEGSHAPDWRRTKAFMRTEPAAWDALLSALAEVTARHLGAQVAAGAQAIELFDSFAGILSRDDWVRYAAPYTARIFAALADTPTIHFATTNGHLLAAMRDAGGDAIGIDYRLPLGEAWARVGDRAIQGNLDPTLLLTGGAPLREGVAALLAEAGGRPGHIVNLGGGVLPGTTLEALRETVALVHELSA
jgi:uroporphyrinogen decarboxylase